jgi:hypothetical protein
VAKPATNPKTKSPVIPHLWGFHAELLKQGLFGTIPHNDSFLVRGLASIGYGVDQDVKGCAVEIGHLMQFYANVFNIHKMGSSHVVSPIYFISRGCDVFLFMLFKILNQVPFRDGGKKMNLIDRLKSAHSFHGDPLHREAWEKLEQNNVVMGLAAASINFANGEITRQNQKLAAQYWQSMDTAPKDGTEILLFFKLTRYSGSIQEGWYDDEEGAWQLSWGEVDKILSDMKPIKWMPRPIDPEEIEIPA